MKKTKFNQLSFLVVDDFSSFRASMSSMLNRLGVKKIDEATNAQQAIKWCKEREFDFILCDYNLSGGRNGQHILEELRHQQWIRPYNLFVMVTAESSKSVVLSAYDYEPDDYLTKPLNLQVLEQRLGRMVQQRDALVSVYRLLESQQIDAAIVELERIVKVPGRHTIIGQKMLGQLYLDGQRLDDAETLYRTNLDKRHLDWALLGVAKVAIERGKLREAEADLDALIKNSRLFLPAYDSLAAVYERQGRFDALLSCMQEVVQLSPKSLLRQRRLVKVAMENGDVRSALDAALATLKLGEASCLKSTKDVLAFLNAAGNALEAGQECRDLHLLEETKKCLVTLKSATPLDEIEQMQAYLLTARVHALSGDVVNAKRLAEEGLEGSDPSDRQDLDVSLAEYSYLVSVDDLPGANVLADQVIARYADDNEKSFKLDRLLLDPKNEVNRQRVAQLNRAGIEAHKAGQYEEALVLFRRAILLFPRHVGIHLNCLQTMIAELRQTPEDRGLRNQVRGQIDILSFFIVSESHPQYARFQQLMQSLSSLAKR